MEVQKTVLDTKEIMAFSQLANVFPSVKQLVLAGFF